MLRPLLALGIVAWTGAAAAQTAGPRVRIEGLSERPPDRISIFTVRGKGISTLLISFQETARQQVEDHLHARVVSMDEMFTRGRLSYREMVDCRADADCYAGLIGNAVDARYLLVITANEIAGTRLLGARLLDLVEKRVVGEALEEVESAYLDAVPGRIREAVPAKWWDPFGSLRIAVNQPGAQISVRRTVVGMSPLGELSHLLPGTYEVEAEKKGYLPAKATAKVEKGRTAELRLELVEEAGPESSLSWLIWVGVGAAVVAGGATAVGVALTGGEDLPPSFCTAPGGAGC